MIQSFAMMPLWQVFAGYRDGDERGWDAELLWLRQNHSERLRSLRESVERDGIREPILLGNDGRVWDGHHRLCIAMDLGLSEVPVTHAVHPQAIVDADRIYSVGNGDFADEPERAPQSSPERVEQAARALHQIDLQGCEILDVSPWSQETQAVRDEYLNCALAALTAAGVGELEARVRLAEDARDVAFEEARRETERANAAEAEVARLRRWKDEALPVMSGLQDLGRALNLRPGTSITGESAAHAARTLRAQVEAVRAAVASYPDPCDVVSPGTSCGWKRAFIAVRAALGES